MGKIERAKVFLTEARAELKKVVWPNKQQTVQVTWVVIALTVILALFLGVVDFGLSNVVKYVLR